MGEEDSENEDNYDLSYRPPAYRQNSDRSLKTAIKQEIHSALMSLIFKQFENFVGSFIDL